MIEEGLANYLGTKENHEEYETLMSNLATDIKTNSELLIFESTVSQSIQFNGYPTAYPTGAAICELVHHVDGDKGLIRLMSSDTREYQQIINTVCGITKMSATELENEWTKTILKYFQKE